MSAYDIIIVGAGSTGCVLANRLSADGRRRVLLIEAGGEDRNPLISMPKGMAKLVTNPRHAWHFPVQQARVPGQPSAEVWVRGKGIGGSSSVNGMIYVRGQPQDYEAWAQQAGDQWGWAAMKAAFKAIEDHELGADELRGEGGPLHVSTGQFRYPLTEAMIQAGEQMGLQRKDDLNREDQEGVGYYAHTIRKGRRVSAATAFLKPVRHRKNLTVMTGVQAQRIVFDGQRAAGVRCRIDGRDVELRSTGEIVLCCGAIQSPQLLQLSGVGDAAQLGALGIPVVSHNPDVGARLREHLGFALPYRLVSGPGLNRRFQGLGLVKSVLQYGSTRSGPMATGPFEVGAFVKSGAGAQRPDVQLYLSAFTYPRREDNFPILDGVERDPGITIYGQLLQLTSEGTVKITSPDPQAALAITPNWLSTEADCAAAVAMVKTMRRFMQQPALAAHVGAELFPGAACQSDAQILDIFRTASLCGTHAVGTCRMGQDPDSVVDERLRVRGTTGLRVADCSVMPGLVSGNTNGPAMALGWRAADLMLQDSWARGH